MSEYQPTDQHTDPGNMTSVVAREGSLSAREGSAPPPVSPEPASSPEPISSPEPASSLEPVNSLDAGTGFDTDEQVALRSAVEDALYRYFKMVEDGPVTDLHGMVMSEVEMPLLQAVMRHTDNNQSKASAMLGINRGTLRNKLKQYDLL